MFHDDRAPRILPNHPSSIIIARNLTRHKHFAQRDSSQPHLELDGRL
jgi:hypothetical protein